MRDLWPAREHQVQRNGREVVATYDYVEGGCLRFQVVRFWPKSFAQRRPIRGGWAWTLAGGAFHRQGDTWKRRGQGETSADGDIILEPVRPFLFHLDELDTARPECPVFVVEGEKDVLALEKRGLLATCNPMGAGKWQDGYSQALRGRHVLVIPDNDEAGRKHAHEVEASVRRYAAEVAVLELGGLPDRGDVSDWFAQGGEPSTLLDLADQALTATVAPAPSRRTARLDDLIRAGAQREDLWPRWIQRGVLTAIAAEGGTGKTRFVADLLRRIRHGPCWPDGQAIALPPDTMSLWVLSDNHHDEMVTLCQAFGVVENVAVNAWASEPYDGTGLDALD